MRIWPGSASFSSRAATFIVSPSDIDRPAIGGPTTTVPVLMPIRSPSAVPTRVSISALSASTSA